MRATEKQLISALSRYIVKLPHDQMNRFITSRISKSMERSRFYRDFSVDLRSGRDKSVYLRSLGFLFSL